MIKNDMLQRKNMFVMTCFALFFISYIIFIGLKIFSYNHTFTISTIIFFALIYLLHLAKISQKIIQVLIIISLNVLILLLILESSYNLTIFLLILYFILMLAYASVKLIISLSTVISLEILFITMNNSNSQYNFTTEKLLLIMLAVAIILIGIIQSAFIQYNALKERQKLEEHFLKNVSQQAYLKQFFESANDGIAVFDLENNLIDINPAFEKLYGWTKEEGIGKSLPLVAPHNVKAAEERFKELLKGKRFVIETDEMKKDGTIFRAQISLSPIIDKNGNVMAVSVISRDISYMRENERLQMQSEKLKLAGEIAAGVAHEIRNPMTVISSFVQMMQADEQSPYKEYISIVQDEIERIDLIISEFLVLSKPHYKEKDWVNLVQIIEEIAKLFSPQFDNKNIEFSFETDVEEANIYGNKNQLKQVFINLLKNSMEAIQTNGSIQISLSKKDDHYAIIIKDDGCGMDEEVVTHIFEPFFTTKSKGTGLGMMIISKIIQEHYGQIKVFSKENAGTDIHIQIGFTQSV